MIFEAKLNFGDSVSIDNGPVVGRVIGFSFYPHGYQVQVSWWNNGDVVEKWVGAFRLTLVEDVRK
jgi:hypothetical protein